VSSTPNFADILPQSTDNYPSVDSRKNNLPQVIEQQ